MSPLVSTPLSCDTDRLLPSLFSVHCAQTPGVGTAGAIVEALHVIKQEAKDASISTARGYMKQLSEFEFYISLTFAMPVFEITDRLSTRLQGKTVLTGQGVELVHQAVAELTKLRSEDKFAELWDTAETWRCSMNADPPKLTGIKD